MVETQVREKPILFSGSMVRAILDGKKTQTRRVIDFGRSRNREQSRGCYGFDGYDTVTAKHIERIPWTAKTIEKLIVCPYGVPGDRLWVRETWQQFREFNDAERAQANAAFESFRTGEKDIVNAAFDIPHGSGERRGLYAADYGDYADEMKPWRPSIFMPRWASRISLEILKVRVERVQDISKADCIAEGMAGLEDVHAGSHQSYAQLWDSINAKRGYSWESNPFVWVIEFKPVTGRANP